MSTLTVAHVCSSKERIAAVRELSAWAAGIHFAYAWVSSAQGQAEHFNSLDLSKVTRGVVGLHFAQTEPEALEYFRELAPGVRVMLDSDGVFHPKVLIGRRGASVRLLMGSSNFTLGGFRTNDEANLLLEGPAAHPAVKSLLSQINGWWQAATPITSELIRDYRVEHRKRPWPDRFATPFRQRHQEKGHPLEVMADWTFEQFLAHVRRAENLGDAPFDLEQSDSLASEIGRGLKSFGIHQRFADMPLADRRLVAGLPPQSTGWLGRMGGAGRFMHLVAENPTALGKYLDRVPLDPDDVDVGARARKYMLRATELDGVGLACASRILASKRPDRFFPVNEANKQRAAQLFAALGGFPKSVDDYMRIHAALWELPLFNSPQPRRGPARIAWTMRIALLDRLLYNVTADVLGYDR